MDSRSLLELRSLPVSEIIRILDTAQAYHDGAPADPTIQGRIAANLFFEPSTRTQYSFNVAELKLGMRVVSFNPETSSLKKDESFYDTVKTFDSFGTDLLVIRHSENEYYKLLGNIRSRLINGGDGTGNHPTQSLLDLLTIRQEFGAFKGLRVSIIGDIVHSRVAHTDYEVMQRLGAKVCTSGPEEYMEKGYNFVPFEQALKDSDVVMLLRVQHERHLQRMSLTKEEYHSRYGINTEKLNYLKKGAIIMHPAPFNRGVEIADEVVECDRSRIFKQVENGVFCRMAAITRAIGEW